MTTKWESNLNTKDQNILEDSRIISAFINAHSMKLFVEKGGKIYRLKIKTEALDCICYDLREVEEN